MSYGVSIKRYSLSYHLMICVVLLLVVAGLSLQQIDLYPPTTDEFLSMYNAGGLVNSPYSPLEILQSLEINSPQHTPGYFLLLSAWGNVISWDIAIVRVLTIFLGLLSMAMIYRLAKDFVAPIAGIYAIVILASNVFYSFYLPHTRMYTLMMLLAMILLWLYMRILYKSMTVTWIHYCALFVTTFALINTHIFSVIFLAMLGIYHLIFAPKNRPWLLVSATIIASLILFLPYVSIILSGLNRAVDRRQDEYIDAIRAIEVWLTLLFNGDLKLLALSGVGLALGVWQLKVILPPYLLMGLIYLCVMGFMAQYTTLVTQDGMRYLMSGWVPCILLIAAGLVGFYSITKWTSLLLIFWLLAGITFTINTDWETYLEGRFSSFQRTPIQVISRLAREQSRLPFIIAYRNFTLRLDWESYINFSQNDYYFEQYELAVESAEDLPEFEDIVNQNLLGESVIWLIHKESPEIAEQMIEVQKVIQQFYVRCGTFTVGIDTIIDEYQWKILGCDPPLPIHTHQSSQIDYQYYATFLDSQSTDLLLVDRWTALDTNHIENFNFSYQLITAEWGKVAQLDLPLVEEGNLRLLTVDVQGVPAGEYRLIGILYDKVTGDKQIWTQDGSDMLFLAQIVIP